MTSNEDSNQEFNMERPLTRPPIVWFMDQYLADAIEAAGKKSDLALQLNLLAMEYEKTCAQAKIKLYNGIIKLVDQKRK
jgi:hypothetical protein